jgi:uncharacterized membrane protein
VELRDLESPESSPAAASLYPVHPSHIHIILLYCYIVSTTSRLYDLLSYECVVKLKALAIVEIVPCYLIFESCVLIRESCVYCRNK